MAEILVDIDEDLLAEALITLGTGTSSDTLNEALRRAVQASRERRRRALEDLQRIVEEDGFDFSRLDECES